MVAFTRHNVQPDSNSDPIRLVLIRRPCYLQMPTRILVATPHRPAFSVR